MNTTLVISGQARFFPSILMLPTSRMKERRCVMIETEEPPQDQGQHLLALYTTDTNGTTVQLEAVRRGRYPRRFLTMFPQAMEALAKMDRPACYHRALYYCLSHLDPVQWRHLSARDLATDTRQSMSSAERALSMLEADGVVIADGRNSAAKRRRLNNNLCWASSAHRHSETTPDPVPEDARGRQ